MKTTTYICDICNKSVSENELVPFVFTIRGSNAGFSRLNSGLITFPLKSPNASYDICKECLKKKGFVIESSAEKQTEDGTKNLKTFEAKFLEILQDLGVVFEE